MADWGAKVSRPGFAVTTADARELIWSTAFNAYKISAQGATTVAIANGQFSGTNTIAHGLAYTPSCLVYFELASGKRFLAGTPVITGLTDYGGYAYTDGTNIVLFANRAGSSGNVTVNVYYYVLKEVGA